MSRGIFNTPWSPLITNGLGTSACCGLLLAGLGAFTCFGGITPPDPPFTGGGGGSIAVNPGIYVPWPKGVKKKPGTRAVVVTVKMKEKTWTRNFVIAEKRAPLAVSCLNVINKTASKITVGVDRMQRSVKQIKARFGNDK